MAAVVAQTKEKQYMGTSHIARMSDYVLVGKLRQSWCPEVRERLEAEARRRGIL